LRFDKEDTQLFELKVLHQERISVLQEKIKTLEDEIELLHKTMNRMDDL
jgi:hypothetical protein